jgi:hypothetical protein
MALEPPVPFKIKVLKDEFMVFSTATARLRMNTWDPKN